MINLKINIEAETSKVAVLESKLHLQEEVNNRLASRVKMLEYALKQML